MMESHEINKEASNEDEDVREESADIGDIGKDKRKLRKRKIDLNQLATQSTPKVKQRCCQRLSKNFIYRHRNYFGSSFS